MSRSYPVYAPKSFEAWTTELTTEHTIIFNATDLEHAKRRAKHLFSQEGYKGRVTIMATDQSESWTGPLS